MTPHLSSREADNPTTKGALVKPAKPYEDFPLFPHANGQWAKKIRGRLRYFGPWNDWQKAKENYERERDGLPSVSATVGDLVNAFLRDRRHLVDTRELAERSWHDYYLVCARATKVWGRHRLITELGAEDFDRLRANFGKTRGLVALSNDMTRLRVLFNFGVAHKLAPPIDYRLLIKKPKRDALRRDRAARGSRTLTAAELRTVIDSAPQPLKAMVLLGVNCGYGNQDVGTLPCSALDLQAGWVEFPRPKTGIVRRAKLWPETIKAVKEAIGQHPTPKDPTKLAGRAFLTAKGFGYEARSKKPAAESHKKPTRYEDNPVSKAFAKLLRTLKIHRPGLGFYSLRRLTETIGGGGRDQVAVDFIMGHAADASDMGARYREFVDGEPQRLEAVADHIHAWLWPPEPKAKRKRVAKMNRGDSETGQTTKATEKPPARRRAKK